MKIRDLDFGPIGVVGHQGQLLLQPDPALMLVFDVEATKDVSGARGAGAADDDVKASGGHGRGAMGTGWTSPPDALNVAPSVVVVGLQEERFTIRHT